MYRLTVRSADQMPDELLLSDLDEAMLRAFAAYRRGHEAELTDEARGQTLIRLGADKLPADRSAADATPTASS